MKELWSGIPYTEVFCLLPSRWFTTWNGLFFPPLGDLHYKADLISPCDLSDNLDIELMRFSLKKKSQDLGVVKQDLGSRLIGGGTDVKDQ